MLNVGEIIIIGTQGKEIITFDFSHPETNISSFVLDFVPLAIVHPPTYLNKIVILGDYNLELRNIRTTQKIFDYSDTERTLTKYFEEVSNNKKDYIIEESREKHTRVNKVSLLGMQTSPALDILALALSNGDILLLNLKVDKILQRYRIKDARPVSMSFSQTDIPLLAVGDDKGDITVFNLNEENIVSVIKNAHKSIVNYVEFMKEDLILLSGSYNNNNIIMWQYDELEDAKFRCLRKRVGLSAPIKKLGFYGDEGYHVIASSLSDQAELKDYFLWNEGFEGNFSLVYLNISDDNFLEKE